MSITLSRDAIQQHNGKYSLAPLVKPKAPEPAPPAIDPDALTSAMEQIVTQLAAGRVEQRSQIAEMLAALAKPEPQHANWTVTVTHRDAKGRIQQVDFVRKANG